MIASRLISLAGGFLLFAFLSLLISVPWGYAVLPLFMLVSVLVSLPMVFRDLLHRARSYLGIRDFIFCFPLILYSLIWSWDVWASSETPIDSEYGAMSLWPAMSTVVLVWFRLFPPSPSFWWAGIFTGASLAGCIALFQRWVMMHDRVGNGMNAIPFGNLALLLGCLSLIAYVWRLSQGRCGRGKGVFLVAAAAGGIVASLLSGTRGGWVVLPLLSFFIWVIWRSMHDHQVQLSRRFDWDVVVLVSLILVVVMALGSAGPRITTAFDEMHAYWSLDFRGGSIGLRLEMWKGGVILFSERPLTGWGEGGLQSALDTLVSQGLLYPGVSVFTQLHSDMIDTAARRGLVGLVSLLGLYGVPLTLFWRCRRDPDPRVRLLAIAGVMIVTSFMIFGLSQSMLRDVRGLSGYLGLCVGCWAVLRSIESSNRSACPPGERCVNAMAPVR